MKHTIACLVIFLTTLPLYAQTPATRPYDKLPQVPAFTLTSTDIKEGAKLATPQMGSYNNTGGLDVSPQLAWNGFPKSTKSFVLTVFDPDAPMPGGFWHWEIINIPMSTVQLPTDAGRAKSKELPLGAVTLPNGAKALQFFGAAPPAGSGKHRYIFAIHALDVARLDFPQAPTPEQLCEALGKHTIARATITAWAIKEK